MFGASQGKLGLDIISQVGSFIVQSRQAAADRKWQAYNNKMTRLQDAINQNALTSNERMRKEKKAVQLLQVQKSEGATVAKAEVSAAATGTVGRSVNMVIFDIKRNAATARQSIERDDEMADEQTDHQRMLSAMSAQMQLDLRSLPGPSAGTLLAGLGSTLYNYDK